MVVARGGRAFTLVELLVVLAIIAIIAGVAAPNLRGSLKGMRVRQAALTLAEHVCYAQMLAVEKERPTRVVIDAEHRGYRVELADNLLGLDFQPAPGVSEGSISLPEGVDFEGIEFGLAPDGEKDILWFEPAGVWSTGRLRLTDGTRTFLVRIGKALGRVEVFDLHGQAQEPQEPDHADLLASPM